MTFHASKTKLIKFRNDIYTFAIALNGHNYEHVESVKNLGVTISSSLDWPVHISIKLAKRSKVFHYIKRTIPFSVSPYKKYNLLVPPFFKSKQLNTIQFQSLFLLP